MYREAQGYSDKEWKAPADALGGEGRAAERSQDLRQGQRVELEGKEWNVNTPNVKGGENDGKAHLVRFELGANGGVVFTADGKPKVTEERFVDPSKLNRS